MPATVILSKAEADFLRAEGVAGVHGYAFEYDVKDTAKILGAISKTNDAYPVFSGRLAAVASQLGCPDVMFAQPAAPASPPVSAQEPAPIVEPDPLPVSQAQDGEHSEPTAQ